MYLTGDTTCFLEYHTPLCHQECPSLYKARRHLGTLQWDGWMGYTRPLFYISEEKRYGAKVNCLFILCNYYHISVSFYLYSLNYFCLFITYIDFYFVLSLFIFKFYLFIYLFLPFAHNVHYQLSTKRISYYQRPLITSFSLCGLAGERALSSSYFFPSKFETKVKLALIRVYTLLAFRL